MDGVMIARQLPKRSMALVLAGGRGSRLKDLTDNRAKPAVYFGGKFRIVDFALSNCINSGIRRIGVITQYKSHSLLRHLQRGWSFLRSESNEFIDLLPAQQQIDEEHWYQGTADAVFQNLDIIRRRKPGYVLILSGDHIYSMDYDKMLNFHKKHHAKVTIGTIRVPWDEASRFGIMVANENMRITKFQEKPAKPESNLASMGIYIFDRAVLEEYLRQIAAGRISALAATAVASIATVTVLVVAASCETQRSHQTCCP